MKTGICYIVGAGENYGLDFIPEKEDFVIAADAGFRYLRDADITPDLIVGDFDSLNDIPQSGNILKFAAEKDDTVMFIALKEGIGAGYRSFHIYGGTGGRIDHTIANIQMLAYISERKMKGCLFHKDTVLIMMENRKLIFDKGSLGYVSVFSYSEKSTGVYLRNLKYELVDATLTNSFQFGVSNELVGKESSITVENGVLLISFPRGLEKCIHFIPMQN